MGVYVTALYRRTDLAFDFRILVLEKSVVPLNFFVRYNNLIVVLVVSALGIQLPSRWKLFSFINVFFSKEILN